MYCQGWGSKIFNFLYTPVFGVYVGVTPSLVPQGSHNLDTWPSLLGLRIAYNTAVTFLFSRSARVLSDRTPCRDICESHTFLAAHRRPWI
jgi:hypothetical protein